jgi:uncharacterized cupin superfamily protein
MNFVLGSCTFTPDGKAPHQLRAGDTLFLPENTKGVWVVHETVRKVYVLFEHKPKAD